MRPRCAHATLLLALGWASVARAGDQPMTVTIRNNTGVTLDQGLITQGVLSTTGAPLITVGSAPMAALVSYGGRKGWTPGVSPGIVDPGGADLGLGDDGLLAARNLGFNFVLNGTTYTQIRISANGFVGLGNTTAGAYYTNSDLPNAANPNAIVAAFWDDLYQPAGGFVHADPAGTPAGVAPNRSFRVLWSGVPFYSDVTQGFVTFELILYENNGAGYVEARYGAGMGTAGQSNRVNGNSATIGWENATGTVADKYHYDSNDPNFVYNGLMLTYAGSGDCGAGAVPGNADTFATTAVGSGGPGLTAYGAGPLTADKYIAVPSITDGNSATVNFNIPCGATSCTASTAISYLARMNGSSNFVALNQLAASAGGTDVSIEVVSAAGNPMLPSPAVDLGEYNVGSSCTVSSNVVTYAGQANTAPDECDGSSFDVVANATFLDITGTGTAIANGGTCAAPCFVNGTNDSSTNGVVPIGFTFVHQGIAHTGVVVSTNGWASFDSELSGFPYGGYNAPAAIPTSAQPFDMLAPFWHNLTVPANSAGNGVWYQTTGSAGSRQFVLGWYNATLTTGERVSFEIILYETSNRIEFRYGTPSVVNANTTGGSATIGVQGPDGTSGTQYSRNTANAVNAGMGLVIGCQQQPGTVAAPKAQKADGCRNPAVAGQFDNNGNGVTDACEVADGTEMTGTSLGALSGFETLDGMCVGNLDSSTTNWGLELATLQNAGMYQITTPTIGTGSLAIRRAEPPYAQTGAFTSPIPNQDFMGAPLCAQRATGGIYDAWSCGVNSAGACYGVDSTGTQQTIYQPDPVGSEYYAQLWQMGIAEGYLTASRYLSWVEWSGLVVGRDMSGGGASFAVDLWNNYATLGLAAPDNFASTAAIAGVASADTADLVAASFSLGKVYVLGYSGGAPVLRASSATDYFTTYSEYSLGSTPAVGDLDGDGLTDIVVAMQHDLPATSGSLIRLECATAACATLNEVWRVANIGKFYWTSPVLANVDSAVAGTEIIVHASEGNPGRDCANAAAGTCVNNTLYVLGSATGAILWSTRVGPATDGTGQALYAGASPLAIDVTDDGTLDIIAASYNTIYVIDYANRKIIGKWTSPDSGAWIYPTMVAEDMGDNNLAGARKGARDLVFPDWANRKIWTINLSDVTNASCVGCRGGSAFAWPTANGSNARVGQPCCTTAGACSSAGVRSVTVTNGGEGYTSAPTVGFVGTGAGAMATASIGAGADTIVSISATQGGTGYTAAPTVYISGGGGAAAAATANLTGASVTSYTMTNNGSGYTSAPTVSFRGGGGSANPTVTWNTGGGCVGANRRVNTITIPAPATTNGGNYSSAPTDVWVGGNCTTTPNVTANMTGANVTSFTIVSRGCCLATSLPTVTFTGGGANGTVGTAHRGGAVTGVTVTAAGSGYSSAPAVTFAGGGGALAAATSSLDASATPACYP